MEQVWRYKHNLFRDITMIQTDRENIAMGYSADEISAFAVLCDYADVTSLETKTYELRQEMDALTFFKTIGGIAATQGDDALQVTGSGGIDIIVSQGNKRITIDGTWLKDEILKRSEYTFKTIGNVSATTKDDNLDIIGKGGITVSASGKTISISGEDLEERIAALEAKVLLIRP